MSEHFLTTVAIIRADYPEHSSKPVLLAGIMQLANTLIFGNTRSMNDQRRESVKRWPGTS